MLTRNSLNTAKNATAHQKKLKRVFVYDIQTYIFAVVIALAFKDFLLVLREVLSIPLSDEGVYWLAFITAIVVIYERFRREPA